MLNLVPFPVPGAGLRSGSRVKGTRWLCLGLLGLTLTGCATKGDIRDIQDQVRALAVQQQETLQELSGLNLAVQDTLGRQSDYLFESRGDTNRRLAAIEQEILTIQELLRMNQQSLMTIRDLIESQGRVGPRPMGTDQDPPQNRDVEFDPSAYQATGADEAFNAAVGQFDRGQLTTARMAFQEFLRIHATHARVPDARFYLADILAQQEQYNEAITAFLEIPSLYPMSAKAPEAYYRVGVIYLEDLDDVENARAYLTRVVESYAESDTAALAQARLDEIG